MVTVIYSQNSDSLYNGYTQFKYLNGQISSEGEMINGKPNGKWRTYFENGKLKSEGNRVNFKLEDEWIFYNDLGDTTEIISFRNGEKNGYHYKYTYDSTLNIGYLSSKELFVRSKKQSKSYYYFNNGNVYQVVNYKNDKRNGLCFEYDIDGNMITVIEYRNNYILNKENINRTDDRGLKQGIWREYFDNDRIKWEKNYLNNELHGYLKEYDIRGQIIKNQLYYNGIPKNSSEKNEIKAIAKNEYYKSGKIKYSGSYRDTIPVGIHKHYEEDEIVVSVKTYDDYGNLLASGNENEDGKKSGLWKEYYVNGSIRSEGNYIADKKNGKWTYFFENGEEEQEGYFKNGKYDGLWQWYYDTGELKRNENYYNGREDGTCIEYSKTGDILETGEYINGLKEGVWVNNIGDHVEKGLYKDGLREGMWRYYFMNGKVKFEGSFIQGIEDGKHKWYYDNGNLMEERYYIFGSKEKIWKLYDEEGNLFMATTYRNDKEIKINGKRIDNKDSDTDNE